MESGQKRKVVVLHVNMLKLEVHVSLHQDLVNRKARKVSLLVCTFVALCLGFHTTLTAQGICSWSDCVPDSV